MSDCTVTSIGFDKFEQLIVENQKLKEQNKTLIAEKQRLINENMNLKMMLRSKKPKQQTKMVELISEHKGVIQNDR